MLPGKAWGPGLELLMKHLFVAFLLGAFACSGGQAFAKSQTGLASYYKSGKRTANGERFQPNDLTAAHRTLPFGTRVLVTNLKNGKSVIVRINDRGPFIRNRVIDLSLGAARFVDLTRSGVVKVKVVPLN